MFERYTEKARRVIFFARYEASQYGSPYIESEHLLLGILREDKALTNRFLRSDASVEAIRKQIDGHTTVHEKISTSIDLPLANDGKRILAFAAEEAERMSHPHIGTEHLLLGILREKNCFAAKMLDERGLRLDPVRAEVLKSIDENASKASARTGPPLVNIRFAHAETGEDIFDYSSQYRDRIPSVGETVSVALTDGTRRIFRVRNVTWHYIPRGAEPPLQEIEISLSNPE